MLAVTLNVLSEYSPTAVSTTEGPYLSLSPACQSHFSVLSIPAPLRERCGTQDVGHIAFRLILCLIHKVFTQREKKILDDSYLANKTQISVPTF